MPDQFATPPADPPEFSVDFISDIHADWWKGEAFDYAAHKKNDIVIIAGDLAAGSELSIAELKKIAAVYKTVLFVDGNYEFRTAASLSYNFDFAAVQKALHEGIAAIPNVVYLHDHPFVHDGVAIIGRNGFWDYRMVEGVAKKEAVEDAAATFKTTFDNAASFSKEAWQDFNALRDQLVKFNNDPSIHTIVVVTHTVPHPELLDLTGGKFPLVAEARMGSSLMDHLLEYDTHKKVKTWLFGHAHVFQQLTIDGVFYSENPRGRSANGGKNYQPERLTFTG